MQQLWTLNMQPCQLHTVLYSDEVSQPAHFSKPQMKAKSSRKQGTVDLHIV